MSVQAKYVVIKDEVVRCMSGSSVNEATRILNNTLSKIYMVEKESIRKPRLKIIGVDFENIDMKSIG